jgi:hypothetical protein
MIRGSLKSSFLERSEYTALLSSIFTNPAFRKSPKSELFQMCIAIGGVDQPPLPEDQPPPLPLDQEDDMRE